MRNKILQQHFGESIEEQIKDLELDIEEIKNGKQKELQPYLYMFERDLQLLKQKEDK